ncbi:sulfotransferase family protein [Salinibacter ruber]|uniref:Sulfotransferase family protein n=1 Tax=Salinibacter ruber TaxID=146919 RepID=A0A9X3A9K6_9BACT|nr:sulfotransferase family protein [Salinibacter ruber]MCS4122727.1 hypothetical protein [Salinibacter ruber]
MKVFGIGLGKTGTSTLGKCLDYLGYDVKGPDIELTRKYRDGNISDILKVSDSYNGFQDFPWPLLYKEMDKRYEKSKFILTTRKTEYAWFESLKKHADRKGNTEHKKIAYGFEKTRGLKEEHISLYNKHNREVREYFEGREGKLLEVCWETGDGWRDICDFLGHDVPDHPFPHINESPNPLINYWVGLKNRTRSIVSSLIRSAK